MSLSISREFALYAAAAKPAKQLPHRWPRMACFGAALAVSLGIWIVLIKTTAGFLGF